MVKLKSDDKDGRFEEGKSGCWGLASPNSLIQKFTPPVCGALGVIGNIFRPVISSVYIGIFNQQRGFEMKTIINIVFWWRWRVMSLLATYVTDIDMKRMAEVICQAAAKPIHANSKKLGFNKKSLIRTII
jgi:hypothetical protein